MLSVGFSSNIVLVSNFLCLIVLFGEIWLMVNINCLCKVLLYLVLFFVIMVLINVLILFMVSNIKLFMVLVYDICFLCK